MTREIPRYEIIPQFWHAWEQHAARGDPVEIIETILALPDDQRREGSTVIPVLKMTTYEAVVDGHRWCLLGHAHGSDMFYVFELQPRGKASDGKGGGDS